MRRQDGIDINMNVKKILPLRLASSREFLRMTQAQLAKKTGLRQDWISHFECGRRLPNAENLLKLAVELGCSTDYLLGRFEENNSTKKGK